MELKSSKNGGITHMTLSGKRLFSSCATRLFVVAAGNLNSGAGKSRGSRSDAGSLLDGELFHFVQIRRGVITAVQEREGEVYIRVAIHMRI